MIFGKSVVALLIAAFIAVCVFFLAQWAIPLLFELVGFTFPEKIANILALLIALGGFGYWWHRPRVA